MGGFNEYSEGFQMFGYIAEKMRHDTPEVDGSLLDAGQIEKVMEVFRIGSKIRYAPDYRPEVTMDSLIIAYGVNNHLVYAQQDIRFEHQGEDTTMMLDDDWKDRAIQSIRRFCVILPDIGNLENVLDYDTRAKIHNGGQLQRGDKVSLMSLFASQGLPHVDAMVRKRVTLRDGYYANHSVIVLEIEPHTMRMVDQRQHYRIQTRVPVTIRLEDEDMARRAVLVDFSEYALRLSFDEPDMEMPPLSRKKIFLNIELPEQEKSFTLQALPLRQGEDFVVLKLTHLLHGDELTALGLLDVLDIKASLLQRPETS